MRTEQKALFSAKANNASGNSAVMDLMHIYTFSVMSVGRAGNTGTIKLQGSNDILAINGVTTPQNWFDITGASITLAGATIQYLNLDAQGYRYMRAVFTTAGGAGTFDLIYNAKGS